MIIRKTSGIVCVSLIAVVVAFDLLPSIAQEAAEIKTAEPVPDLKQLTALENDPTIRKANADFEKEIRTAKDTYAAARSVATKRKLDVYRRKLADFTKAGDFDRGIACKTLITKIESNGNEDTKPRPNKTFKFDGHHYALIEDAVTWHTAKRRCEEMGGHLAFTKSPKVLNVVAKIVGENVAYLGASDEEKEGDWRWLDGSKWIPQHQDVDNDLGLEHSLTWDGKKRILNDRDGAYRLYYVCEWDN